MAVASIINYVDVSKADVVLMSANYDRTSSFGKGAHKGPQAIINCLDRQIELDDRFSQMNPASLLKIAHCDLGDLNEFLPEEMIRQVSGYCSNLQRSNRLVIVLGGEHSVTNGPIRALWNRLSPKHCTVVQIDAHLDLRDDDSDYAHEPHGRYAHSCVMRRVHGLGFAIVSVGIRAYCAQEYQYATDNNIPVFMCGPERVWQISHVLNAITTKNVYLTIDVDGIDPAHMPATGTPVQGGLEWYSTIALFKEIFRHHNVVGYDIVEVAPRPGDTLTEYGAAQLCYTLMGFWKKYQKQV